MGPRGGGSAGSERLHLQLFDCINGLAESLDLPARRTAIKNRPQTDALSSPSSANKQALSIHRVIHGDPIKLSPTRFTLILLMARCWFCLGSCLCVCVYAHELISLIWYYRKKKEESKRGERVKNKNPHSHGKNEGGLVFTGKGSHTGIIINCTTVI